MCFSVLAIAVGFLTSSPAPAAPAGGAAVNLVGVSVASVPVSGTVGVNNFPATQPVSGTVNVGNTPTVSLSAGSSVNASSPLDGSGNPIPLATLDASQPYEDRCSFNFGGASLGSCLFHAVPAGKRLVIQEVDVSTVIETGLKPLYISVAPNPTSSTGRHFFTATFMGPRPLLNVDYFVTHQETRLYAGPNQAPVCEALLNNISNFVTSCQLSGFLVDVP